MLAPTRKFLRISRIEWESILCFLVDTTDSLRVLIIVMSIILSKSDFLITILGLANNTNSDYVPYQVERGRRGCDYDRVEILELANNSSRGQYCGNQPPEAPVSTRGGMVVR